MKHPPQILDCTLRDGGYYTKWHFDKKFVLNYLNAVKDSGISTIEVGFRSPRNDQFWGPYAYCSDKFLEQLPIPSTVKIGVMINAKDYICDQSVNVHTINKQFNIKETSPIHLIRIAAHYHEVPLLPVMVDILLEKGYEVAINLMQTGERSESEIENAITTLALKNLTAIIFADSFGNMQESQICSTIEIIKRKWKGTIGIHAHNNMGRAVINCEIAKRCGVTWFDGTMLGMGRGAGNAQTEYLLMEFAKEYDQFKPATIFPLILQDLQKLHDEYRWGPNLLYNLSAQYNIHPTYIQEILLAKNSTTDIINALENLKKQNASSYSKEQLSNALKLDHINSSGDWDSTQLFNQKDVLIIGSGPSVEKHKEAIESYIDEHNPVVISLNINDHIHFSKIDAYSACHPIKLYSDAEKYKNLKRPIILPINSLDEPLKNKLSTLNILNYGLKINPDHFTINKTECDIPAPLVFAYVLAAATAGNANRILVAGLDGYGPSDQRQREMENLLNQYRKYDLAKEIVGVTATTYSIKQSSIYSSDI